MTPLRLIAAIGAAYGAYKMYIIDKLKNFEISEFGGFALLLTVQLLQTLDNFRDILGRKVYISQAIGAILRFGDGTSQHFFGRAIDVILENGTDIREAIRAAKQAGFTGIGVYPNSGGIPGRWRMHLDVRPETTIAMWGSIPDGVDKDGAPKRKYVSLNHAVALYA